MILESQNESVLGVSLYATPEEDELELSDEAKELLEEAKKAAEKVRKEVFQAGLETTSALKFCEGEMSL